MGATAQPQIQSSFQRINNYCISYSKSVSKLKCLGNRIPDDNDFESLDKFSIVSLVIHNSITLNFSRYLSFYFLGNRLVIDVKFKRKLLEEEIIWNRFFLNLFSTTKPSILIDHIFNCIFLFNSCSFISGLMISKNAGDVD